MFRSGVALVDGTAVAGIDFGSGPVAITVPAGETLVDFSIPLIGDTEVEDNETFTAQLVDPVGCVVSEPSAVEVTILDDDLVPVITLPYPGVYFSDGDVLTLDGADSLMPPGYDSWFAVLRDDGSDPMDMVYQASGLTDSFTASGADPAYRIRLVVAAQGTLPDDATLRGAAVPCTHPDPDFGCASTEIQVPKANSSHVSGFRVGHVYPEQVMLLWAGAKTLDLERSSDGGETWDVLGRPETENYAVDADIVEGSTYHYRGRYWQTQEWVYLDISLPPPGAPVTIPVWSAPRVLPQLDEVTWHCPDVAARPLCDGTLHMRLQSEPGTGSLGGATIRVYLNEETYELTDGTGNEIHTEFNISNNYLVAFRGYDSRLRGAQADPGSGCQRPAGRRSGGGRSERHCVWCQRAPFRGGDGGGDVSERALLVLIMDEPVKGDPGEDYLPSFPSCLAMSSTTAVPDVGVGPAGRHGPECVDGDSWYYFDHFAQGYNTALFFNEINFAGDNDRLIWTDTVGGWSASYSGLATGPIPSR